MSEPTAPSSPTNGRASLAAVVIVSALVPWLASTVADQAFGGRAYVHEPVHEALELAGTCFALVVSALLFLRVRYERDAVPLAWVAGSLLAMGLMDAVHGVVPYGVAWSWLRHAATLLGGVFFALVWVPLHGSGARVSTWVAVTTALGSALASAAIWFGEDALPHPWSGGDYAWPAVAANAIGGLGFLLGGAWFLRQHDRERQPDSLVFASHALLFGVAGLTFGFSHVWEPGWWLRHGFRLLAYAVVLVATYRVVAERFRALAETAQELERRVEARTVALTRSEQRFRSFVEASTSIVWTADAQMRVVSRIPAWEAFTGQTVEEVSALGWIDAVHPDDRARLRREMERARRDGNLYEIEYRLRRADGTWRDVLVRGVPVKGADGTTREWIGACIDVTEKSAARRALDEAQVALRGHADELERTVAQRTAALRETVHELEAFSYSIAHDMRAPLRAMHGYAQILDEQPLDDQGHLYARRIAAAARRLDQLIHDVLDYSRVVRSELPMSSVDVGLLLRQIVESYPDLQREDVTIELHEPLPHVQGNPAALTQVFSNLLGNAVKFVAAEVHPHVVVRAEPAPQGAAVRLWFEDNGIGVAPGADARIFGMFQRLHPPAAYAGTGIGLAIVRKAVERMGGHVGVESTPGSGSRFWVDLQAAQG